MNPTQTIDQANAELEGRPTQTIDQANAELEERPTQTIDQANAELEGRPTQTIDQANAEIEGRKPVIADDGDKLLNPAMETAKAAWEGAKNTVTSVLNPALKLIGDAARGLGNISANGIVMPNGMVIGGTGKLGGDETNADKIAQMRRDSFGNVVGDKADEWIDKILPYEKSDDAVAGAIQTVGEKVGNLARFMKAGAGTLMVANFGQQWNQHYDEYIAAGRSPAEAAAYADAGGAAGATFDAALKAIPVTHFLKKGFGYNEANSGIKELLKKLGDIGAQEVRGVVGKEVAKDVLANMAFEAMSFGGISAVQTFVDNCIEQQGATGEIDAKQALSAAFDAGMHGAVEGAVMGGLMSTPKAVDMVKAGKGAVQAKKAEAARIEAERVQSEKDAHAAAEAARIAAEEEKVAQEQQRVAASELRGKESVAEQMAGIEEMGVTSWEEAEAKGLTEKDETGAYRGGARQALNIAIHGTDKLKGAVKSGAMSGDTAEAILTTAQCELGARPVEDRAALVNSIVDKAGGDEALARGILRKLTEEETTGRGGPVATETEAIEARVERAAQQVKAEAIAARNGVDETTARSVSVEPVETADGRLTTVGDQVAAESDLHWTVRKAAYDEAQKYHDNNGIADWELFDIRDAIPPEILKEMSKDPAMVKLNNDVHDAYQKRYKKYSEENKIAYAQACKRAADAMMEFTKERMPDWTPPPEHDYSPYNPKAETTSAVARDPQPVATKPQTALEGFENAERLKGTELKVTDNGTMTCNTFPELRLDVSQEGVSVRGITPETMAKPANAADAAAVVARAYQVAKRNGVKLVFESEEAAKTAAGLMVEVQREGLARTQKRLDTRAKVLDTLLGSGLGTHVTFDMGNFKKALEASGTGRRFINQAGDIYAFEDGKGGIHFNPQHLRMDTPFHEYGHLARAVVEKVNPSLWKRGMDLIGETEYFREIAEMAKGEKHPYHGLDEAALKEEAICNLLGDRGAKIIESKGAGAELKKWIRDFWKAIKEALGIADLTEEQIEKMTLEEIADAVNSELLRGREFGKRTKPSGLSRRQAALKRMQGQEDAYWEQKVEAEEEAARQAYIASGGTAMDYVRSRAMESEAPLDLNWEAMRELANDVAEGRFAVGSSKWNDATNIDFEGKGRYRFKNGRGDMYYGASLNALWAMEEGRFPTKAIGSLFGARGKQKDFISLIFRDRDTSKPEWHHMGKKANEVYFADRDIAEYPITDLTIFAVQNFKDVDYATQKRVADIELAASKKIGEIIVEIRRLLRKTETIKDFVRVADPEIKRQYTELKSEMRKKYLKVPKEEWDELRARKKSLGEKMYKHEELDVERTREATDNEVNAAIENDPRAKEIISTAKKEILKAFGRSNPIEKPLDTESFENTIDALIESKIAHRRAITIKSPEEPKLNRGRDASYHGEEFTKSDAEKSTGNFSMKGRVMDDAARKGKFAVGGVYTGSAADYEKPSLQKIGTGEGSQVYGWGLYGSKVRDVAEGYARARPSEEAFDKNGNRIKKNNKNRNWIHIIARSSKYFGKNRSKDELIKALDYEITREQELIDYAKDRMHPISETYLENLKEARKQVENGITVKAPEYVYEQTFFTNREPSDESHLLSWYKRIGSRKEKLITSQLEKEGWKKEKQELGQFVGAQNTYTANISTFKKIVDGTVRKIQLFESMQARDLYDELSKWPNSPKAASEFLARADIDGIKYPVDSYGKNVKNGDKAGWNYVSFRDDNITVDHKWVDGEQKFQAMKPEEIDMSLFTWKKPGENDLAMGDTEQNAAGIAAGIEKKEALRPWTKKMSPADQAKPIAFDAADMVMFWRAVSGALRNPVIKKGDHIPGHKKWVGMNRGGDYIELASKLFGIVDTGDIERLKAGCVKDGYFRHLDDAWRSIQSKLSIKNEQNRSEAELDKRTRELYEKRVTTGEGGEHYATQVLGHEIGHTLAKMPADKNLGPIGNPMKTLFETVKGKMLRHKDPLMKKGETSAMEQVRQLIAWWHGTEKMPEYYEKPEERFAELFGIFLTQPESVQARAPKAYDMMVDAIAGNEKATKAYRTVAELKWSGQSNDAVLKRVQATWDREAQEQYRKLAEETKESVSSWKDAFNYALNDRFGPIYGISKRGIKAEKAKLDEAVRDGKMSPEEAADRLTAMREEVNAFKTSLYNWQRQSGGSTRLMIAGFDEVKYNAEKAGVNWNDVRDYAHFMRVIELGGRATAHGVDPARAAAILGDMARRLGAEKWAGVDKTAKAFRAVYEREVLDDPNVKELFDDMTNKMLAENKHYVTMKHRMGVEEAADWQKKIEEYRKGNSDAWDPCIDIQTRLNKGLGGAGGSEGGGFVLHRLVGSFEATEDPLAATMKRAIEIKEAAARNHLIKQTSETLRAVGAKGVFDVAGKGKAVDPEVYGKLAYMDKGVKHELIVPKIVWKNFKSDPMSFGKFGEAMRFFRNTMTLWNPAFINRAYLIDKSALETNIKGLHKPVVDALSEALCFRGIGVPLYLANNYLTRFTPVAKTWWGKMLWNENTVNHYAYRAQQIAKMAYEGKFGERLAEARELRAEGDLARAREIEEDVAICQEMLRRNVFQSQYQFNKIQKGLNTDDILKTYGYRIEAPDEAKTWYGKTWNKMKAAGRVYNRFEEEQEACTKIIAYLYKMKQDAAKEAAGQATDPAARAREVIEQGGTPNLSARGVMASYIENATGFFWNVRKEGSLRTLRALRDHPTEWVTKNLAQTAFPALLKALMVTGGLEVAIRSLFDDDEEKIKRSWWAPSVIEHARWMNAAMKCVPGYYQQNYNIIPLAKFGDEVLSLKVKYSPEEFAMQNAIHTAMQMMGKDPTDPSADWSTLAANAWSEMFPNIFGRNYAFDALGTIVGPIIGINPYDQYRQRNVYDKATWDARWDAPGNMMNEIGKNFWNYSPIGTFTSTFKNGQERKLEESDVPAWIDAVLQTPVIRMVPASMLTITSSDSYEKALRQMDEKKKAYAKVVAADVLAKCIESGILGGFEKGLQELQPEARPIAIRHVINGWRKYHEDPRAARIKRARSIKSPELRRMALEWIDEAMKYDD